MKIPFIVEVPDFQKEVEEEAKQAPFYNDMDEHDQKEYVQRMVAYRAMHWSCRTSCSAYNLCLVLFAIQILINGPAMLALVQAFLTKLASP